MSSTNGASPRTLARRPRRPPWPALSLGLLAALVGCGGAAPAAKPKAPPTLLDLVADESIAVVHLDFGRLRASRHYAALVRFLETPKTRAPAMAATFGKAQEGVLAITLGEAGKPAGGGLLLRGTFSADDVKAALDERATAVGPEGKMVAKEVSGHPAWTWHDGAIAAFLEPNLWLTTSEAWAERSVRAATRPDAREPLAGIRTHGWQGTATVRFAADLERVDRATVATLRAQARGPLKDLTSARRISGSLDLENGLKLRVGFTMRDEAAAGRATKELEDTRRRYAGDLMLRALGLAALLDGVAVSREGPVVHVALSLDARSLDGLLDRLSALIRGAVDNWGKRL